MRIGKEATQNMDKKEARAVIKDLHKKGMTAKEIHKNMRNALGEHSPCYSTVKKWVADFKRGRESTSDDPRSGRPKSATTHGQVETIHLMVMNDRRVTVQHIAESMDISVGSVHAVLTDVLGMSKLSARWVPRMLTPDQRLRRMEISRTLLDRFQADPEKFIGRFVTQYETWVHHFDPESKRWKHMGCPAPKKLKKEASVDRVKASVFWDSEGLLMIDFLQKGQTVKGDYYASRLQKLKEAIKDKRRGKLQAGVLLLQDFTSVHTAQVEEAAKCGFELLPHAPYSPDLAPSDFYLFPKLRSHFGGRHFQSDDEVIRAVEEYLDAQDATFFREGIAKLEHRWTKCIEFRGNYVEK
uniref:Mos1 transposase HTH domain-containing protein n=1 Tax=Stegastes partitus TaxID=144197 RepID=A0A3B5BAW3_9TELE